jgi:Zn-dependent protease with chaperone function
MAYLMIVQIFALAGAGVAYLAGAPKETGLILTLGGGLSGILAGLGLTFAMAPVHVRKMFPSRRVEDPELDLLLKSCFARAGVAAPDFWVVECAGYRWNNAWIAGFSSGRGWFRPGLFLTESLVQGCSKEELEAIVLHEVSHVALGHLKRRFGYTLAMVGAALVLATTLMTVSLLLLPEPLLPMARIAALTAAIATPFILVRRLVERQEDEADRHAVIGLAARLDDFARALRTVDRLNNQNAVHPNTEARITRVTIAWERHLAAVKAPEAVESERRAA